MTDRAFAVALMAPAALFLLLFVGYPLVRLVFDSLFDVSVLTPGDRVWVGLDNYVGAISDRRFQNGVVRTCIYTVTAVGLEFTLGLLAALLFHALGRRSAVFRTLFAFPLMIAPIVAGLMWRFMLINDFGIINEILAAAHVIGSPHDVAWLSDPTIVLFSVVLPDVWLTTSFVALVLYAGLESISSEVLEAARVDGASRFQTLVRITLPLLRPVIAVALIIRGIDAARAFDVVLVMTDGGPNGASELLSFGIYREMIRFSNLGYASAMATLFLLGMLVIALGVYVLVWRPAQMTRQA